MPLQSRLTGRKIQNPLAYISYLYSPEVKNAMLKRLAYLLSVIFHPLLIPTIMLFLLLLINPYLFNINDISEEAGRFNLLLIFLYTFFIPAVSIIVLYFLGWISSPSIPDRQERIAPYLITGMLYLWVFYNFYREQQMPTAYVSFMLGTVIALFLAFFLNLFTKISAHTVGMGGLVGMVLITLLWFSYGAFTFQVRWLGTVEMSVSTLLLIVIFLAGLVGSARLLLNSHNLNDLFGGYLVGFIAQLVAFRFLF